MTSDVSMDISVGTSDGRVASSSPQLLTVGVDRSPPPVSHFGSPFLHPSNSPYEGGIDVQNVILYLKFYRLFRLPTI